MGSSTNMACSSLTTSFKQKLALNSWLLRYDEIDMLFPARLAEFVADYGVYDFEFDGNNVTHLRYKELCKKHGIKFSMKDKNTFDIIDLEKLFQDISVKRKGDQHRVIKQLVPIYEKRWNEVLCKNTNRHVFHLLKLCKNLNLPLKVQYSKDKFKIAQMYAIRAFGRMPGTLHNILDTTEHMCGAIDNMSGVIHGMSNNMHVFNNMVQSMLSSISRIMTITDQIIVVIKLVAFIYMCLQESNQSIANVGALLILIIPTDAVGKLTDLFVSTLMRAVQGIRIRFANIAQVDYDDSSIFTSFWQLIKLVVGGLFKPIEKEHYERLSLSSKKIKLLSDFLRSSDGIFSYVVSLSQCLINILCDKIVKYYGFIPKFLRADDVNNIIDEYHNIQNAGHFDKCLMSVDSCKIVVEYMNKVVAIEAGIYKRMTSSTENLVSFRVLPYLRCIIVHLKKIIEDIPPHVRNGFEGFRMKPFWLYLFGESHIAKSSLLQPVIANLLAAKLKLVDQFDDPHNYSYFRTCGAKFYAKYNKQPIMQYNDLFQNFSDEEAMNEAVIELTNIVDEAPYELNMPDVESKGKVYCVSKIVISNAQADFIGQSFIANKCWSGGIHLYRRRNLVVEPCINPAYRSRGTMPGIDWNIVSQSSSARSTYIDIIPADLYSLKFYCPTSGRLVKHISLDAGLEYICEIADAYFNTQNTFHANLVECMRRTFNEAQMDIFRWFRRTREEVYVEPACNCEQAIVNEVRYNNVYDIESIWPDLHQFVLQIISEDHISCCLMDKPDDERNRIVHSILVRAMQLYIASQSNRTRKLILTGMFARLRNGVNFILEHIYSISGLALVVGAAGALALFASMRRVVVNTAQSDEGNKKAVKVRIRRRNKVVGSTTGVAQYDTINRTVEDVVKHNMATFIVRNSDGSMPISTYMRGMCLGGSVFVLPKHYWNSMRELDSLTKESNGHILLYLRWYNGNETQIPWTNIDVYESDVDYLIDVIFLRIRRLTARRDIRHFFVNEQDDLLYNEAYLFGVRSERMNKSDATIISVDGTRMVSVDYHTPEMETPYGVLKSRDIKCPVVYEYYNCKTVGGDCGALLMFVNPKLNGRVIAGIHVGGNSVCNSGFSAPIFREDVDEAFEHFGTIDPVICHEQVMVYNTSQMDSSSFMHDKLIDIGANVVGSTLLYKGKKIKCVIPRKSNIVKSCVYDMMTEDFGEARTAPARLKPFVKDGVEISPFINAYKKTLKYGPQQIPLPIYDDIVQHIQTSVWAWKSPYTTGNCEIRVLDDLESINGVLGMKQLDLSTSPGFPYVFDKGGVGKRPWFDVHHIDSTGFTHYMMNSELLKQVEDRIDKASRGIIKETYFIDTLKDETRPIDKVEIGKTRLFQIGPMDLSIAIRKYFGCYIAHLHMTFIDGEGAIGIDCNSVEWHYLVKMMNIYQHHGCGDFREFDYSTMYQIGMSFADNANKFYGDDNNTIRLTLVASCINGYHIVDTNVVYSDQGNNSGVALTSDLNNNTNMFIFRLAYSRLVNNELSEFNGLVKKKFYGDDNWINISDTIIDKYNMITLERFFAAIGFVYTSATKDDIHNAAIGLHDVTFLKRRIEFNKVMNIYVSQLDLDVIREIPRWSESNPNNMSDQMNRFNSALIEISNYGRNEYNNLYTKYVKYIKNLNSDYHDIDAAQLLSYKYIMKNNYDDRYNVAQMDNLVGEEQNVSSNLTIWRSPCENPVRHFHDSTFYVVLEDDVLQVVYNVGVVDPHYFGSLKRAMAFKIIDMLFKPSIWLTDLHNVGGFLKVRNYYFMDSAVDLVLGDLPVVMDPTILLLQLADCDKYDIHGVADGGYDFETTQWQLIRTHNNVCKCKRLGANHIVMSRHCFINCCVAYVVGERFAMDIGRRAQHLRKMLQHCYYHCHDVDDDDDEE